MLVPITLKAASCLYACIPLVMTAQAAPCQSECLCMGMGTGLKKHTLDHMQHTAVYVSSAMCCIGASALSTPGSDMQQGPQHRSASQPKALHGYSGAQPSRAVPYLTWLLAAQCIQDAPGAAQPLMPSAALGPAAGAVPAASSPSTPAPAPPRGRTSQQPHHRCNPLLGSWHMALNP